MDGVSWPQQGRVSKAGLEALGGIPALVRLFQEAQTPEERSNWLCLLLDCCAQQGAPEVSSPKQCKYHGLGVGRQLCGPAGSQHTWGGEDVVQCVEADTVAGLRCAGLCEVDL